ncbi:MAG TPA: ATPase domain-containing protein [Deltaproteobacteria bacterium]|nr:ATPase domain-containing protein [Deltaproteobacteria bacterium]HPP79572.1 ATPase domain-containing protein [Deltaproteobacteria bacterium]
MENDRVSTGISGLDEILDGGLIPGRTYLVRGGPGTGKTTLGLHFLVSGKAKGDKALFISLGEPESSVRRNAERQGLDLGGVSFLDLSPTPAFFAEVETYDIFSPAEVEREPITRRIVEEVENLKPSRVFIDSMTQFRYLAADPFQYRKQVLSFLRFLVERNATVLFASESSSEAPDDDLQFVCDGVIRLNDAPEGRSLSVSKFRGSSFLGGRHAMVLGGRGMEVFPRLVPEAYRKEFARETIPSGIPELDELLHGGLERGTVTLLTGPSGVGKSTLGMAFMKEAAGRGERSVMYTFEEEVELLLARCEAVNIPAYIMVERGTLAVEKIEPLRYSPEEFACAVRREVEGKGSRIVMLDSVSGYRLSLRGEDMTGHLHALCTYLKNMGVTVLLVNEVEHITGEFRATEVGISYLADNIVFLRYLEMQGELHKAIGVLKKRLSDFERTLREFQITRYGLKVGKPLVGLRGILTGTPEWTRPPG